MDNSNGNIPGGKTVAVDRMLAVVTGGKSVGNLQEVAGCRAAQTVLCRIVKNCAELCGSLQNCADCVAGGTGLAGSWCAGWAVGTHLQLHLQSSGGETFTQPSPAAQPSPAQLVVYGEMV